MATNGTARAWRVGRSTAAAFAACYCYVSAKLGVRSRGEAIAALMRIGPLS